MIAKLGSAARDKVMERLAGTSGINGGLAAMRAEAEQIPAERIVAQNAAADLAERSSGTQYPVAAVYCEKVTNALTEKFRRFSGSVGMVVEVRHSQDRITGLQESLESYADAAGWVLEASRGDWGDGMFYDGRFQVAFGPVKHGGKNFLQSAKITFEIGVSRS